MTPPRLLPVLPQFSWRQLSVLAVVGIFVLASVSALVFGPARGARDDLHGVRVDLHASRTDIHSLLATQRRSLARITGQLHVVRRSLVVQQRGLAVAQQSEQLARTGVEATQAIRRQTGDAPDTLHQVLTALGPLQELRGDITTVVRGVTAGVALARSALSVAQQTLQTGQRALAVAVRTLDTLQQSRGIQAQLLDVARQTLRQAEEINRKIPTPPVFPTGTPTPAG